ncbi:hypothetical protein KP79_PYT26006 [Mizuhopecten yessoensis]|uniref:Uncharacterized protein n=1 Tax=Mizuhopecten yessoensis TaxID=6573 RepID=A0A210PJR2_MIZYE|nr:hypothetical protein KP79_PYT26006 [Mizuhopecten yessoensis]
MCYIETKETKRKDNINYHRGNYPVICEGLKLVNWDQLDNLDNLDDTWNAFVVTLQDNIQKHIPVNKASNVKSKRRPLDPLTLQAVRKKHQTWTKYLHCKTPEKKIKFREARNNATACLRSSK